MMRYLFTIAAALLCAWGALTTDAGGREVLRLSDDVLQNGEWRVAVHVINQAELAALDIPIRFGEPGHAIELLRVDFAPRVADWDFAHAQIDNQAKTVILGLISELVGVRANADLKAAAVGDTRIADLVFRVAADCEPRFETFKTQSPGHALTFIHNRVNGDRLEVMEIEPEFEVAVSFRAATLPTAYTLSPNFPNPFNPTTSFVLSLPDAAEFKVTIFNVAGQLVREMGGHAEAGVHTLEWDGRNDQGFTVASGVYFYRVEANRFSETRKMMLLK